MIAKTFASEYTDENPVVNLKYIFNCPDKDSKTNRKDLAYNDSYTLTKNDYFKLVHTSKSGKITTCEYKSHDNITYTIVNKISNFLLVNLDDNELREVTKSGNIIIQETTVNNTYQNSFINLNNYELGRR